MQVERAPWHRDLLSKDQTKHYEASRLWSMKYLWLVTATVLHQQHQEHHEHPKTEDPDGTVKRRDVLDCSSPTNEVPYQGSVNLNTINIHWEIHPLRTLRSFGPRGAKSPPSGNLSVLGVPNTRPWEIFRSSGCQIPALEKSCGTWGAKSPPSRNLSVLGVKNPRPWEIFRYSGCKIPALGKSFGSRGMYFPIHPSLSEVYGCITSQL